MLNAGFLALSTSSSADEVVDPRYHYSIEVAGTVGSASIFSGLGYSQLLLGGAVTFFAPVAESRKISIGLRSVHGSGASNSAWFTGAVVGYRIASDFDRLQTRLDLQLAVDTSRIFIDGEPDLGRQVSVGPRLAVGGLYSLGRGWKAGVEVSAAVMAFRPRAQFELNPLVHYGW